MAKKPDTPCIDCGKLLWSGPRYRPAEERRCKDCRESAQAGEPLPSLMTSDQPADDFAPRGRRLWREMDGGSLKPAERVLLEEACRLADRLDRLDALLAGRDDAWWTFRARNDDGSTVEVVVDKGLAESRQQVLALKAIVSELRQARAGGEAPKQPEATRRDELAKRREERRRAAGL